MVLYWGGPLCQLLHEMESCPVFLEQSATPFVPLSNTNRETGWYVTVVQMVWLTAQRRQDSFPTHAAIGRRGDPDIGPWVRDG